MNAVFIISGDPEIRETAVMLRSLGREVVHDDEIEPLARETLCDGKFVVVAHGNQDGSVILSRTSGGKAPWLWVGMPERPTSVRIYLYACHAGKELVPHLYDCEAFGHIDRVPVASSDPDHCVSRFLARAGGLVAADGFDREAWQANLCQFLDAELKNWYEKDGAVSDLIAIELLRQSLNYGRSMWA